MKHYLTSMIGFLVACAISLFATTVKADPIEVDPDYMSKRVLMVVSGNGKDGGRTAPGYEFEEFSTAYLVFSANGIEVDIASPSGGKVESDPYDPADPINARVLGNAEIMAQLENSLPLAQATSSDYDAVFIVGGKGAMFDLHDNPYLQSIISDKYVSGGIVAAVCHGPAALVNVVLPGGEYLLDGKRVNGFTNVEERMFGQRWIQDFPFLLEDRMIERGGRFESSPMMLSHVTVDGRLITGQNPASTPLVAEEVVRSLGITPGARPVGPMERTYALLKAVIEDGPDALADYNTQPGHFNGALISMYGFFTAKAAESETDHETAIALMSVDTPVSGRPRIRLELAKSWLHLGETDKAREIAEALIKADPSNGAAIAFAASLG